MLTTEELDALDALRAKMTAGVWAPHPDVPRALVSSVEPDVSLLALDMDEMAVLYRNDDADGIAALVNAAPRLLAAAREAATFRAKLIESETWRTELRTEMGAVTGKLREVTAQRDAAVKELRWHEGFTAMRDRCSCCGAYVLDDPCKEGCALSAAREEVKL